jgi:hypothetical protein
MNKCDNIILNSQVSRLSAIMKDSWIIKLTSEFSYNILEYTNLG